MVLLNFRAVRFFLISLIFCSFGKIYAQPHLVATAGSILTPTVNHCQNFECSFTIKNTGTAFAPQSFTEIRIANNTSFISPYIATGSSVKSLSVGDSTTLFYTFSTPSFLASGSYYVGIFFSGHYNYLTTPFTITTSTSYSTKIPYPIIFIHGLNGSDQTWDDFTDKLDTVYGFQFGGRMNFCLNRDNNQYTANFLPDYTDFTAISNTLIVGDYYYVNFAVNNLGIYNPTSCMYSNQSAIYKQGRALRDAIEYVLQVTGRGKVILVGHSMGGLASREYLENPAIWQPDGKNHVAKLFTIGTPHGGSNLTASILSPFLNGIDEYSEAVRDLRYPNAFYSGVFLNGGLEPFISTYRNNDINCNGILGELIIGLNHKPLPLNISYSCTIGTGVSYTLSPNDDGVVDADKANLNNYYTGIADTFNDAQYGKVHTIVGFGVYRESHTLLNKNFEINMKGLDEDNYYNNDYPYQIGLNNSYYGFIQKQSGITTTTRDYDNYKFICTQKGTLIIKIENIIAPDFKLWLIDSSNTTVALHTFPISSNQNGNIDVQLQLPVGKYILQTDAAPITNGYYYPYLIKTSFTNNWTTPSYTICTGGTQLLTAPSGFSNYQWARNGLIIPGANTSSLLASTAGYYSFRTTNSFGYVGTWSDSVLLNVVTPGAGTINGPSSVCVGGTITLANTTPGGIWTTSNSYASIAGGNVTGNSAGVCTISYTVTNVCGTSTATKTITVNPLPTAAVISGPPNLCVGSTITLTPSISGGTWAASNSNVGISGGAVTGISAGSCIISYSVSNSCGTTTTTKSIFVISLPDAGTITGPTEVCAGETITLVNDVFGGTWSSSDITANVVDGVVTGVAAGSGIISYSVTNMCGTVAANRSITVHPAVETPAITISGNVLSTKEGYTHYQWFLDGTPIADATAYKYKAIATGVYSVNVTNSNNCTGSSAPFAISEFLCNVSDMKIHPNPAESIVYIDWCKKVTIRLASIDGKVIKTIENDSKLDLGDIPSGIYQVSVFDGNNTKLKTERIIKLNK